MKIALYQMEDRGNPAANIEAARKKIMESRADFLVLPEFFTIPGGDFTKPYTLEQCWQETGLPSIRMFKEATTIFKGYLICGTILEKADGVYYNTCFVYKNSILVAKYHKINLTQEEVALNITPGSETTTFYTPFGWVGLIICADCFSKITVDAVAKNSDIIFFPVSLTDPNHPAVTGHPLSEIIAKKYNTSLVKVTRIGTFNGEKITSKSAVITPQGVIFESGIGEELALVEIPSLVQQGDN
jgi:predicted amidohydrolase